jgi:predicted nuclease of predicted toxin-antitoxin system
VKLLLDEMLSGRIAEELCQHDHDTLAVEESANLRGLSDPDLFAHAQELQRTIVTYNREDFLASDREYQSRERPHYGIVILHPRRFPQGEASMGKLLAALSRFIAAGEPYPNFIHWLQ